jgi:hypothetical protein
MVYQKNGAIVETIKFINRVKAAARLSFISLRK